MVRVVTTLILLICMALCHAQETTYNTEEISITKLVDGTLMVPSGVEKPILAIIIQGSGPTDRDGNQMGLKNNSLKFLAQGLYDQGIASFRFDKRILRMIRQGGFSERNIRFDDFVEDAVAVVDHFKDQDRFSGIYIIGHSQGSLIGMLVAQGRAQGFVSVAGAGQEIDDVVVDQLRNQAPGLVEDARKAFDDMRVNGVAVDYGRDLASIFRPDIQPFMISWMNYNPQEEIKKLEIPVLIANGSKDLQTQVSEAQLLKEAKPDAEYVIIENMNHVLKEIGGGDMENSRAYNDPLRPVAPQLIDAIAAFIKK